MKPECRSPTAQESLAAFGDGSTSRPSLCCRGEAECSGAHTPHGKTSLPDVLEDASAGKSVKQPCEESQEVGYDKVERQHGRLKNITMASQDDVPAPKRRRLRGKQRPFCPDLWKSSPKEFSQNRSNRARRCQQMPSASSSSSASVSRRICIAVTGFEVELEQRHFLERLGIRVVDEWSPEVTHLIANTFRRTLKMMCSVCAGARIYTSAFLEACYAAGQIPADDSRFALRDVHGEKAFASRHCLPTFALQGAIAKVLLRGPLLAGRAVYCSPDVEERKDLQVVVEAAGGLWLHTDPDDHPVAPDLPTLRLGQVGAAPTGAEAYDKELLLQAACIQELRWGAFKLAAP